MARIVRQSSYRHVFGTSAKTDFSGLAPNYAGDGNGIAVSTKYFALPQKGGGGPVLVHTLGVTGRLDSKKTTLTVHRSTVLDVQFSPFADNILASGDDAAGLRVTALPELNHDKAHDIGVDSPGVTSIALEGHGKRINMIAFHPTAENVLASCSEDQKTIVWDYSQAKEITSLESSDDTYKHAAWNSNGSLLALAGKEKKVHLYDPRDSKTAQTFTSGLGPKKSSVVFADNAELIITAGTNVKAERVIQLHDPKALDKPVHVLELDKAVGLVNLHYDPDNSILWVLGKGDGRISYFELVKSDKALFALSQFQDTTSQKTGVFFPKRCLDTKTCEIARCLRALENTVVPVSFQVPRKSDLFQKDLFPDTYAGVPSLSAAEYAAGKNAEPKTISMKPGSAAPAAASHSATLSAVRSAADYEAEIATLKARIAELEKGK
jgi:coronin-1B/1C/6